MKNTEENSVGNSKYTYECINCKQIVRSDSTPEMCPMCGAIVKKKQIKIN